MRGVVGAQHGPLGIPRIRDRKVSRVAGQWRCVAASPRGVSSEPTGSPAERRRSPWRGPLALAVVAIVVLAALASVIYLETGVCAARPSDAGTTVDLGFGPAVPGVAPGPQTYYENISLHPFPTVLQASCGSEAQTLGTANFALKLVNASGTATQLYVPATAVCVHPENFSSCSAPAQAWYVVLFSRASAPSIQSSFPQQGGGVAGSWTSTAFVTQPGEELSLASPGPLNGTGILVAAYGTGPWSVYGGVYL